MIPTNARYRTAIDTPYGTMNLAVDEDGTLIGVSLPNRAQAVNDIDFPREAQAGIREAIAQLREYFSGTRRDFDLRIAPAGSPFERSVWERLRSIPYGVTFSYGVIANELGLVNGARAVGRANGANPIPIVIPCHRVIGGDGSLTGFGGGLPLKRALLELEGAIPPPDPQLF